MGVRVVSPDAAFELTIYDAARLGQEIAEELQSDGFFAAANLVVVPRVTRTNIIQAVERLSRIDFQGLIPQEKTQAGSTRSSS
ncbi:hypothetical protein [Streptosporangium jomthongense]|uniref:Uncharacterized protein n=1 Tax=Streptosporangium jomthongense TaxID=1193683 RepID=A0ABV8EWU0_9ACTN